MPVQKRALIADDHSLYRQGLSLFLKERFSYSTVGEAENAGEAAEYLNKHADVELALFDLQMPGMAGPASLNELRARHPRTKFAFVTASEAKADVMAAVSNGVSGFIPKTLPVSELAMALTTVLDNRVYVPASILASNGDSAPHRSSDTPGPQPHGVSSGRVAQLTPRQAEVLEFIRAGMSNREIAERLGISVGTVKVHVAVLLKVMGVRSRMLLASH